MRHELASGRATQLYLEHGQHLLTEGSTKPEALSATVEWLNNL